MVVIVMILFLNKIRKPEKFSFSKQIINSTLIFIVGIVLGIISKLLDETPSNILPYFLEKLDLSNFFSRMGIWIFLAVLISVYSKSPIRASINVFLFFVGMVSSYYLYTIFIAEFYPKSYMCIWIYMTIIALFLAFIIWYAKGKGIFGLLISTIIFVFISRQTFAFGFWYFDIKNILELLLWLGMIFVLYQSPKQISKVIVIGLLIYFLTAQIDLFWGML